LIPPQPEVEEGPDPRSFPLSNNVRIGIMVCWESLFADHARTVVADQANVLLMLANEGWFGRTAAGAQHNLTARLRAVEMRRAVIVASNMGPSLIVAPYGQELGIHPSPESSEWLTAVVPLVTERSLYARLGDSFVFGCGMIVLVGWVSPLLVRKSPLAVFTYARRRVRLHQRNDPDAGEPEARHV